MKKGLLLGVIVSGAALPVCAEVSPLECVGLSLDQAIYLKARADGVSNDLVNMLRPPADQVLACHEGGYFLRVDPDQPGEELRRLRLDLMAEELERLRAVAD